MDFRQQLAAHRIAAGMHPVRFFVGLVLNTSYVLALAAGVCAALAWVLVSAPVLALPVAVLFACLGLYASMRKRDKPATTPVALRSVIDGLETERMVVRRPVVADAPAIDALVDQEMIEANGLSKDHVRFMTRARRHPRLVEEVTGMLLCDRATGQVLGEVTLASCDTKRQICELGWWLGPPFRNQGYGTEALRAVLPALHASGIVEVRIGTSAENAAVVHVLDKLGLHRLPSELHKLPNGTTVATFWYVSEPGMWDGPEEGTSRSLRTSR